MPSRSSARLQLIAAAVLFSTGGAAIKAAGFNGWQIASFRSGVAVVAILLMTPAARRGWTPRAVLVCRRKRVSPTFAPTALLIAGIQG